MNRSISARWESCGSMMPKIKAALDFIEHGGDTAIITSPQLMNAAIRGEAGTRIICNVSREDAKAPS